MNTGIPEKRWAIDLECSTIRPVNIAIRRGESWRLCAKITQGGRPFSTASDPEIYWQPISENESFGWWHHEGFFDPVTGEVSAEFSADDDSGADGYRFYLKFSVPGRALGGGRSYSAAGIIRMAYSPGATPNSLEPPVREIDFDKVVVKNAPYILNKGDNVISVPWSLTVSGNNSHGNETRFKLTSSDLIFYNDSNGFSLDVDCRSIKLGKKEKGLTQYDELGFRWPNKTRTGENILDDSGDFSFSRLDFEDIARKDETMKSAAGDLFAINTFSVEDASDFEVRRAVLACVNNLNKIIQGQV